MPNQTTLGIPELSNEDRLLILRDVYERTFNAVESFYVNNIGGQLAYLMGSILIGKAIGLHLPLTDDELAFADMLGRTFDPDHVVWRFVEVISEDDQVRGHPYFVLLFESDEDEYNEFYDEDEVD